MRDICFTPVAFEEYNDWAVENKKVQKKIAKLIGNVPKIPLKARVNQKDSNIILKDIGQEE
jgi:Txe/YoeB family toxin of Txe-Axe toxin-antitoxin module